MNFVSTAKPFSTASIKNDTQSFLTESFPKRKQSLSLGVLHINKKGHFSVLFYLYGTPKRIRIAVYTVKGCCPRPLDDGGLIDYVNTMINKFYCQHININCNDFAFYLTFCYY